MCKLLLCVCVLLACSVAGAADFVVVNLTGTNWVSSVDADQVFPPGVTRVPAVEPDVAAFAAYGGAEGLRVVVYVDGGGVSVSSAPYSDSGRFWQGFTFVFTTGLLAVGASWVRKILGGSGESSEAND